MSPSLFHVLREESRGNIDLFYLLDWCQTADTEPADWNAELHHFQKEENIYVFSASFYYFLSICHFRNCADLNR